MPFVLDANIALSWHFEDEESPYADSILERLAGESVVVPSVWSLEVGNGLLGGIRRRRLSAEKASAALQLTNRLPLRVYEPSLDESLTTIFELARDNRLSSYDAAYLHVALVERLPLATQDADLRAAAVRVGVDLVE